MKLLTRGEFFELKHRVMFSKVEPLWFDTFMIGDPGAAEMVDGKMIFPACSLTQVDLAKCAVGGDVGGIDYTPVPYHPDMDTPSIRFAIWEPADLEQLIERLEMIVEKGEGKPL